MCSKRLKLFSILDSRFSTRKIRDTEYKTGILKSAFVFLILIFLAFAISATAEDPAEEVSTASEDSNPFLIKSIEIQGSETMPAETILGIIQTRVGEEVSLKQIREDVKVLFKFGQFSDIQVNSSGTEDGIHLTFVLKEWPKIKEIDLSGNEKLSDGKINDVLTIEPGHSLSGKLIHENKDKITSLYQRKGYYLAQVEPETIPNSEGTVNLSFNINEGHKIEVEEIDIIGNRIISDREIKKKMKIKKGKRFDDSYFEVDLIVIERYYRENGFINAKIVDSSKEFNEEKTGLTVRIELVEGQQFRIGAVQAAIISDGESLFEEKEILKEFALKEGDIFSEARLNGGIARVSNMYFDKGRVAVNIEPDEDYDVTNETVALKLTISEGSPAYIDSVQINWISETDDEPHKSKDYIIRRELDRFNIKSGELFSHRNIRDAQNKIRRQFSFIRSCNPVARPQQSTMPGSEDSSQRVVVNFDIEESPQSGMFSIAGGYGSEGGIFGALDIWDDNILGKAWRLHLRGEIGTKERRTGQIFFNTPWIFNTPTSLGFSLYSKKRSSQGYYSYDEDDDDTLYKDESVGGSITLGRPLTREIDLSIGLRNENVSYKERITEDNDWEETYAGKTRSIKLILDRDTRQFFTSMFDPSGGSSNTLSAEFSGLGGDTFQKYSTDSSLFIPTWWKLVLVFHLRTGYFTGEYPTVKQLRYERFYLGGIDSIRGYGRYSIVPDDDEYKELGGNQMAFLNVEYRFPITDMLRGLIFFDAGETWADNEWPWDRFKPKKSIGIGLRIDLLGALARLEYGYPLDDGRENNWHFDIGPSF